MGLPRFIALPLLGLFVLSPAYAGLPTEADGAPLPSLAPMLERITPAVVNVATVSRVQVANPLLEDPFFRRFFNIPNQPREREAKAAGSGVVVDAARGYILTNNHVVGKADQISVTLRDGRRLAAELVGTDPDTDVAVIKVPADKLTAIPLADSDQLRVGDFVVAIGNPFGLGQTVTSGIVSALSRSGLGIEGYEDFIQTDASINPGNSGGALVDLKGRLVGINTAIIGPAGGNVGIGFAIPANMAKQVMEQLVAHGEVKRGRLGVSVQDLTPDLADAFNLTKGQGAVVAQVDPHSPAERAGLRAGDVITAINGKAARDSSAVRNAIGLLRIGDKVELELVRDGRPKTVTAVIAEPKLTTLAGEKLHPRLAGATFADIPAEQVRDDQPGGVVVAEVERGSAAWEAGLRKGDLILSANRQPVANLSGLSAALQENRRGLLLNVQRGDTALFLMIR